MNIQKEREAFESATNIYHCIYNADLNYYFSGSKFVGEKAEIEVNAGWKAWQAAKAKAVPEGFVLVNKKELAKVLNCVTDNWLIDTGSVEEFKKIESLVQDEIDAMFGAQEQAND